MYRAAHRGPLDGQHFDLAVIGGGINGVAIARECALAGKRVLLVEKNDFAAGTTSRSTRIIHGGLRYLEHGELALVRESLRERQRLLCERPHLVRHMEFLLALSDAHSPRSALEVRFGLWLYRKMAGTSLRCCDSRGQIAALEAQLDRGDKWALFSYDDAQCEFPERLVAEWLGEAMAAGALVRNHTQAVAVERRGPANTLVLRDGFTSEEWRVTATWIVNATGPWADRVAAAANVRTDTPMIGGVRGSHIVVRRFAGAPTTALYTEAVDGRPIFCIPWNAQVLFGTTEVRDSGDPDSTAPDASEIAYLFDSLHRLFPAAQITPEDVRFAFAGVRPLPYAPDEEPSAITRRSILRDHSDDGLHGMLSVIGGKLTTAASLARDCARAIGIKVAEPPVPVVAPAPTDGIDSSLIQWARTVACKTGITERSARSIAEWHGRHALSIACLARQDAALRTPLCEHTDHLLAEAVYALQNESAVTLGDILLRRVPVALNGRCSEECARNAAHLIGAAQGWSEVERELQLEAFRQERQAFLRTEQLETLGRFAKRPA